MLQALEEAKPVITAIAAGQLWYDYNAATDRKFLSGPAYDTLIKNAKESRIARVRPGVPASVLL